MANPKLIVILGPTAAGKTKLAVSLAFRFNGEIISADSRQVYRGMDIGTGKDLGDYELYTPNPSQKGKYSVKIPYHLIDIVSPNTKFSLAKYQKLAYKAIDDIIKRGKVPFLVGGTGLYIDAIVNNMPLLQAKPNFELRERLEKLSNEKLLEKLKKLDPVLDNEIIQNNKRRIIRYIEIIEQCKKPVSELWEEQKRQENYKCLILGITTDREVINANIDERIDRRLEKERMVEEVARLHKEGVTWKRLEAFGLEYKFIAQYLEGKLKYNEMVDLLKTASHQFAKRQMTWFKRDERIKWVSGYREAREEVVKFLK
ncbi:MAG: tRNA (adenosine(37)-N6)-dimethylallyltransferase MiaA [bacterium]